MRRFAISLFLALLVSGPAWAQGALLQGGPMLQGHGLIYGTQGGQATVIDMGGASGTNTQGTTFNAGISEFLQVNRGTPGTGTGPFGTHNCIYDQGEAHYLCLDANVGGHGLITFGANGTAAPLTLDCMINGVAGTNCLQAGNAGVAGTPSLPFYAPLWGNSLGTLISAGKPVGQFSTFANPSAVISRMGDRLFVGQNTNVNDGGLPFQNITKDWMETLIPATTSISTVAAISQSTGNANGGQGITILGAERTSDLSPSNPTADMEAVAGFCIGNTPATAPAFPGCWAGYFETHKNLNAIGTNVYGVEIDMVPFAAPTISANPYGLYLPGGSIGLNVASGGGRSGATVSDAAMMVANNPTQFDAGLVFLGNSITGSDGTDTATCCGNAIELSRMQAISFWASGDGFTGQNVAKIYSSATSGTKSVNLDFVGSGILVESAQTNATLAAFSQGNTVVYASTLPTGCGGGPGPTIAAFSAQGPSCNQYIDMFEDITNNKAVLAIGSSNSGFEIGGLPTVGTGTGKHLLCIDPTTKFIYEGTGATCS